MGHRGGRRGGRLRVPVGGGKWLRWLRGRGLRWLLALILFPAALSAQNATSPGWSPDIHGADRWIRVTIADAGTIRVSIAPRAVLEHFTFNVGGADQTIHRVDMWRAELPADLSSPDAGSPRPAGVRTHPAAWFRYFHRSVFEARSPLGTSDITVLSNGNRGYLIVVRETLKP
jgi:hypothetical protein